MKPATLFQFLKQKICFFVQRQEMNRWLSENREKYDKVMFQETRAFPCREIHCAHLSSILVHIYFMLLQTFISVQLILWSTTHSLKGINALGCSHISQAKILIVMTMKLHSCYSPIQKWQKWQRLLIFIRPNSDRCLASITLPLLVVGLDLLDWLTLMHGFL